MGDYQPKRVEEWLLQEALLVLAMAALALVQVALLPAPLGFPPALLLVLVVCRVLIGVRSPTAEGGIGGAMRWAFYGGLALDLLAATPLGAHALALLLALLLVTLLGGQMRVEGSLLPLLAVPLGALVYEATLGLVYSQTIAPLDWSSYALVVMAPSVVIALVPTPPIFFLMRWFDLRRRVVG